MNKTVKYVALAAAVGITLAGLLALDTRRVREAQAVVEGLSTGSIFGSNLDDQMADERRALHCHDLQKTSPDQTHTIRGPEWRACVMDAMPLGKTLLAAHVFVPGAVGWLKEHPGDLEMKAAVVNLLQVARADLLRSEPWFDAVTQVNYAKRDSYFYRLKEPHGLELPQFSVRVQAINMMEFQIQNPELFEKQVTWPVAANAATRTVIPTVIDSGAGKS
jgi:hypothetical protein